MKSFEYRARIKTEVVNVTATLTEKCDGFKEISIKGTRWYDSMSNCYHKIYVSALVGDEWKELGGFAEMRAGQENHYLVTGGEWLIQNGYMTAHSGYALGDWALREAFNITGYAQDVKRKKDM